MVKKIKTIFKILIPFLIFLFYVFAMRKLLGFFIPDSIALTLTEIIITLILILLMLRTLGTYFMYPGSFKITKSQIQTMESQATIQRLHKFLKKLMECSDKLILLSYRQFQQKYYTLYCRGILQHVSFMNYFLKETPLTERKRKLKYLYEQFEYQMNLNINNSNTSELYMMEESLAHISFQNVLDNPENCKNLSQSGFYQLQEKGKRLKYLIFDIEKILLDYYRPFSGKNPSKDAYTKWKLWQQKFFQMESYYAYWHYQYTFERENIVNQNNDTLQCVLITGRKNQENNFPKAVLFNNPNGAYLQILGLSNQCLNFYLEKGYQIILWNYRGYGASTGSPGIQKSQSDADAVYKYYSSRVQIRIVHGFSIGGACAIHLAEKYESIDLLVTDRTFSQLDRVGEGFLDPLRLKLTQRKWNFVKKFARAITKILLYSDCIQLWSHFLKVKCKKVIIWDNKDEIIVDQASLKQKIMQNTFSIHKQIAHLSEQNFDLEEKDVSESKTEAVDDTFQNIAPLKNQKFSDYHNRLFSIFLNSLLQIRLNPEVLEKFKILFEEIDGGGVELFKKSYFKQLNTEINEGKLKQFRRESQNYLLGLATFGPQTEIFTSKYESGKYIIDNVKQLKRMLDKMNQSHEYTSSLLKIFYMIGKKLMNERSVGNEGHLIVTKCGHNGQLSKRNYRSLSNLLNFN